MSELAERPSTTAVLPTPPTPLVGRKDELADARDLLLDEQTRLLTVTGRGGVGKTRFAIALAEAVAEEFADGVGLVELAAVRDPTLVLPTLVQTLGLGEEGEVDVRERLRLWLQEKEFLLLLDNLEHLLDEAPLLAEVSSGCPGLTLLVTSRERLRLLSEHEFPLSPLTETEAITLFSHRARAVDPAFRLTEGNRGAVAEICSRLDRLPLALELAAARVKLLPPEALRGRLEHRLDLLAGGPRDLPERQQTLRRAIEWSFELLDPEEQRLIYGLSVFVGGCTLEAATGVCEATVDALSSLVDKSLLHRLEDRLTMLETVREFASEQLAASGEEERFRRAHADWHVVLAEDAELRLMSAERAEWLARLDHEHDNLRAALGYLIQRHESQRALQMAGALWRFWFERAHFREGRHQLERALALGGEAAAPLRARALCGAGVLAHEQGDFGDAATLCGDALRIYREVGDLRGTAVALSGLALVSRTGGDYRTARAMYEQAIELGRELGDQWLVAYLLERLGSAAWDEGDYAVRERVLEESLEAYRQLGDGQRVARTLTDLSFVALARGDHEAASRLVEESLSTLRLSGNPGDIATALMGKAEASLVRGDARAARDRYEEILEMVRVAGHRYGIVLCLIGLARVAGAEGRPQQSVRLFGFVDALSRSIGMRIPVYYGANLDRGVTAARAELGEARFESAWTEGETLSLEGAIEEALGEAPGAAALGGLSDREFEVLQLVAEGLSNAQIAERLVVSIRTVHAHLRSIYRKLGVSSRTAAARAARERELV